MKKNDYCFFSRSRKKGNNGDCITGSTNCHPGLCESECVFAWLAKMITSGGECRRVDVLRHMTSLFLLQSLLDRTAHCKSVPNLVSGVQKNIANKQQNNNTNTVTERTWTGLICVTAFVCVCVCTVICILWTRIIIFHWNISSFSGSRGGNSRDHNQLCKSLCGSFFLEISSQTRSFPFSLFCLCRCERDAAQDCSEGGLQAIGGDFTGWRDAVH